MNLDVSVDLKYAKVSVCRRILWGTETELFITKELSNFSVFTLGLKSIIFIFSLREDTKRKRTFHYHLKQEKDRKIDKKQLVYLRCPSDTHVYK